MVRGGAKKEVGVGEDLNPVVEERRRLKKLAFSKNILSEAPVKSCTALRPSKTVTKHHGADILRKSQRKNRFLFSFPGLLAPISGGKIGELKDLGTKNPILYLDFPQGQMKLFGTIVYPKNRYLTLQFSRGGKNVMCEDCFDAMIVFSDAWWIGRKDENPAEARLEFPKELNEGKLAEFDFKGGAGGAVFEKKPYSHKIETIVEPESPKMEVEYGLSDGENNLKNFFEVTPTRHSERTAGKRFKFAEDSSKSDSIESDADTSEGEEKKVGGQHAMKKSSLGKRKKSCSLVLDLDREIASAGPSFSGQAQESGVPLTISKGLSGHTSLVQATISTLFKKVEEKKTPRNSGKSTSSKVSGKNPLHVDSKQKIDEVEQVASLLADEQNRERSLTEKKKAGVESTGRKKQGRKKLLEEEEEEDDVEEFSSTSTEEDMDESDEDWDA